MKNPTELLARAQKTLIEGRFDDSIADATFVIGLPEQASNDRPWVTKEEKCEAYNIRGIARQRKQDLGDAIIDFDAAIHLRPDVAVAWYNRGTVRSDMQDLDGAIADYTEAILLKLDFAEDWNNRGNARRTQQDLDGAIADFSEAIRLKMDEPEAWFNRGNARVAKHDLDGAIADYTEAIRLKPDNFKAWNNRGNVRHDRQDLDGAIGDYSEVIRLRQDDPGAWYNRGIVRHQKKDLDGAIADCDEAIRLKRDYSEAWNTRGNARRDKKDLDGAIADYDKAIHLKPDNAEAWSNRGNARHDKQDLDGAIADYSEAIRLKPDGAVAWYNRGNARRDKKDLDGAISDYSAAIRLNPNFDEAWFNRGIVRHYKQDLDGAIVDYSEAIRLKPDYAEAYANLAQLYNLRGDEQKAIAAWYGCWQAMKQYDGPLIEGMFGELVGIFKSRAPFFALRIISEREMWKASGTALNVEPTLLHQKVETKDSLSPLLAGLVSYHLGDLPEALERFEKIVADEPANMLAQHYYSYCLGGVMQFSKQNTSLAIARGYALSFLQSEPAKVTPSEHYYAGQILLVGRDFAAAREAFIRSSTYLPSLYMLSLMDKQLGDEAAFETSAKGILIQEELLYRQGTEGFLFQKPFETTNFTDAASINIESNRAELNENGAVHCILTYANDHVPPEKRFWSETTVEGVAVHSERRIKAIWKIEEDIMWLQQLRASIDQELLRSWWQELPAWCQKSIALETDSEDFVAAHLDHEEIGNLRFQFILNEFCSNRLTASSALALIRFYYCRNPPDLIPFLFGQLVAAFPELMSQVLDVHVPGSIDWLLTILSHGGIHKLIHIINEASSERSREHSECVTYENFKTHLTEYTMRLMKAFGEDYDSVWSLQVLAQSWQLR